MDTDWLPILDRIGDFTIEEATLDKWYDWHSRFNILLQASYFDRLPNGQRVAMLLMKCKGFTPVWKILGIDVQQITIEYDALVTEMVHYLNPVYARLVLSKRKQWKHESFDNFARELEALSWPCQYRDQNIVRDFFIANMDSAHADVAHALSSVYDVSLKEAVATANALVSQGCLPNVLERSVTSSLPRSASSLAQSSPGLNLSIRMIPISPGIYDVLILNIAPTDNDEMHISQVCPRTMISPRDGFLAKLEEIMRNCPHDPVTPLVGNFYVALIKCKWYRVKVLSNEGGRKVRICAIDFGWVTTASFSVFRNVPLDFRPAPPLLWDVCFESPMPKQVEQGAMLTVQVTMVNNKWVASLHGMDPLPTADSDASYMRHQPPKPFRNGERQGAVSDVEIGENRLQRKSQGDGESFRQGRTQHRELPNTQGRNDGKSYSRRRRSCTRGLEDALTSETDTENTQATIASSNRSRQGRDFDQRGRPVVDRGSRFDNKSHHRNNNYNRSDCDNVTENSANINSRQHSSLYQEPTFISRSVNQPVESNDLFKFGSNSNGNGQQPSSFNPDSASIQSSTNKRVESSGNYKNNRGSNVNGQHHSSFSPESTSIPSSNKRVESSGHYKNNRGNNVNGQHRSSFSPESTSIPSSNKRVESSGHYKNDRGSNASGHQRSTFHPESVSTPNSTNRSVETSNRSDQASNAHVSGQQHSTFHRGSGSTQSSGNNQRLALHGKSRDAAESVAPHSAFVPPQVEMNQAAGNGTRNMNSRDPKSAKPTKSTQSVEQTERQRATRPARYKTERLFPLNRYVEVRIIDTSNDGDLLYCVFSNLEDEFSELCGELMSLENLEPLTDPQDGDLCIYRDEEGNLYRAKITRIHPSGLKVKMRIIDIGHEQKENVSKLMALPAKYWNIQPYGFCIKVPKGMEVVSNEYIEVMPISQNDEGIWTVRFKTDDGRGAATAAPPAAAAAPPAAAVAPPAAAALPPVPRSSVRSRTGSPPPRPPHPPPIPRNSFTTIKIVYAGPEGLFGVDHSAIGALHDIQSQINSLGLAPFQIPPQVDQICAAPFEGEMFRAKVLQVQPNKCLVLFVDFGNEVVVPVSDMKRIPEELCKNIFTFKLRLDPRSDKVVGMDTDLTVTPVVLEPDGSWLVQLEGEPSPGPEHSFPDDDELLERQQSAR